MVKWIFLMPFFLFAQIEVLLDGDSLSEKIPITGSLVVTHPASEAVDPSSAKMNGTSLPLQFVNKVPIGNLSVDTYRFTLPPMPAGLQLLPSIHVKAGREILSSTPQSFEVKAMAKNGHDLMPSQPMLKLESLIGGAPPFYPGQIFSIGYRYTFRGDIELREEAIPLLDQEEFEKLGEKEINDSNQGNLSVREITQQVRSIKPGTFKVPQSKISGYAYIDKGYGPKTYIEPILQSIAPPFEITVLPFPEKDKPPFFRGAIGPFTLTGEAVIPPQLRVGDKITFKLNFQGTGYFSTIPPIDLLCEPGFSGFFETGDLPPLGQQKNKSFSVTYELKVVSPLAYQIPSLYFAYFDPSKGSYAILKTEPIPLKVEAALSANEPELEPQEITMEASKIPTRPEEEALNSGMQGALKADNLEQLGNFLVKASDPALALFYYHSALKNNPLDNKILKTINSLEEKMDLPLTRPSFRPPNLWLYIAFFSFLALGLVLFAYKKISIPLLVLAVLGLLYTRYLTPLDAIVIQSSYMTRAPSFKSSPVMNKPLMSGLKVEVLEVLEGGAWLKVRDSKNNIGYIPYSSLRLL